MKKRSYAKIGTLAAGITPLVVTACGCSNPAENGKKPEKTPQPKPAPQPTPKGQVKILGRNFYKVRDFGLLGWERAMRYLFMHIEPRYKNIPKEVRSDLFPTERVFSDPPFYALYLNTIRREYQSEKSMKKVLATYFAPGMFMNRSFRALQKVLHDRAKKAGDKPPASSGNYAVEITNIILRHPLNFTDKYVTIDLHLTSKDLTQSGRWQITITFENLSEWFYGLNNKEAANDYNNAADRTLYEQIVVDVQIAKNNESGTSE